MGDLHGFDQGIASAEGFTALFAVIDRQFPFQNIGNQRCRVTMKGGLAARCDGNDSDRDLRLAAARVVDILTDNSLAGGEQGLNRVVALCQGMLGEKHEKTGDEQGAHDGVSADELTSA